MMSDNFRQLIFYYGIFYLYFNNINDNIMSWKLTGLNADGTKVSYVDLPVRLAVCEFVKEVFESSF